MESSRGRIESWIALTLCGGVAMGRAVAPLLAGEPPASASAWLPVTAAALVAAASLRLDRWPPWLRVQRASLWIALPLMVWAANGLPFDLLTMTGMMGRRTASGAIVIAGLIGPTAAWALVSALVASPSPIPPGQRPPGIAVWVAALFYGSWFL